MPNWKLATPFCVSAPPSFQRPSFFLPVLFPFLLPQTPQIILLREGTDDSQGKSQIISNINACMAVADAVRSTLGPRGMDKLIVDGRVSDARYSFYFYRPLPKKSNLA